MIFQAAPACLEKMLPLPRFDVLGVFQLEQRGASSNTCQNSHKLETIAQRRTWIYLPRYQFLQGCSLFLEVFVLCCAAFFPPETLPVWVCHCQFFLMQTAPLAFLSSLSFPFSPHLAACWIHALETPAKKPFTPPNLIIPWNMERILPGQPCRSAYE